MRSPLRALFRGVIVGAAILLMRTNLQTFSNLVNHQESIADHFLESNESEAQIFETMEWIRILGCNGHNSDMSHMDSVWNCCARKVERFAEQHRYWRHQLEQVSAEKKQAEQSLMMRDHGSFLMLPIFDARSVEHHWNTTLTPNSDREETLKIRIISLEMPESSSPQCMRSSQALANFLAQVIDPQQSRIDRPKLVVHCLELGHLLLGGSLQQQQFQELLNPSATNDFYNIVLLQDPATWLWRVYRRYWSDRRLDSPGVKSDAPDPISQYENSRLYRSPEFFDEIIRSGRNRTHASNALLSLNRQTDSRRTLQDRRRHSMTSVGLQIRSTAQRANTLFLTSEDVLRAFVRCPWKQERNQLKHGYQTNRSDPARMLMSHLSTFLHLELSTTLVNNTHNRCQVHSDHVVPAAHDLLLLRRTRELLYVHYRKECKAWSSEFGIDYSECG
jgi:hypothetical protein